MGSFPRHPLLQDRFASLGNGGAVIVCGGMGVGQADTKVRAQAYVCIVRQLRSVAPRTWRLSVRCRDRGRSVAMPAGSAEGFRRKCGEVAHVRPLCSHIYSHTKSETSWYFTARYWTSSGRSLNIQACAHDICETLLDVTGHESGGEGGIRTREKQGPYAISSRARSSTPAPLRGGWSVGGPVIPPAWWTLAGTTTVR